MANRWLDLTVTGERFNLVLQASGTEAGIADLTERLTAAALEADPTAVVLHRTSEETPEADRGDR